MKRAWALSFFLITLNPLFLKSQPGRVLILKVDGLGQDLLAGAMKQTNPATGKSELPWLNHLFGEQGVIFDNFYSRGISLSAPSWSILDTGRRSIIRGNVEFDRFTGRAYDYLNFFPFYLSYARNKQVDMPGVDVLDRAGIPLLVDRFEPIKTYMSFQLFQRGVRWQTLTGVLKRKFSPDAIIASLENAGAPSYDSLVRNQTETEIGLDLQGAEILYLDFYTGSVDHAGHATSQPAALLDTLKEVDSLAGRVWTAIQKSALSKNTLLVLVSDHGMNNVPGVISQTYSITDFFSSPQGGGHHIVTDRPQLSDFKLRGLDPLLSRVVTPSAASFYLEGEANRYPTAWLDIDGNERTAVHLRNNDLNRIHILLKEMARKDLHVPERRAAAEFLRRIIAQNKLAWAKTAAELNEEMGALSQAIAERKAQVKGLPVKPDNDDAIEAQRRINRRLIRQLDNWEKDQDEYTAYLSHLRKLLAFQPDDALALKIDIGDLIPERSLGDNNSVGQIQHYAVGLGPAGIALEENGRLDPERTFRYVDYPHLLVQQKVRNMPQSELSPRPIDFVAMALPDQADGEHAYWLYGDDDKQLLIRTDSEGRISAHPIARLNQNESGAVHWEDRAWQPGLPLAIFEDTELKLPAGSDRAPWLAQPHTEREWMEAAHKCRYSNGIIGIVEELSPVSPNIPGAPGMNAPMVRLAKRQRELVRTDFHIFAADHWNFNVRSPNPGGNHGGFFRISTHSVWMMAGEGIPARHVTEPYDGLNFASTILSLMGRDAPMPDRVVKIQ